MTNNNDKPELGGFFVTVGAIGGMLMGIEAGATGEDSFWGALIGFAIGAGVGRVVERVVFRLLVLGFTLLQVYLRCKAWGLID